MEEDFVLLKFLLIGESESGKNLILFRYTNDTFPEGSMATIGIDFKIKRVTVDGVNCKVQIWDTASQIRYQTIMRSYYRGASGLLLFYDASNKASFMEMPNIISSVNENAASDAKIMIIGNATNCEATRKVAKEEGEELARSHNCLFAEVSLNEKESINDAFEKLIRSVLAQRNISQSTQQPPNNNNDQMHPNSTTGTTNRQRGNIIRRMRENFGRERRDRNEYCTIF